MAMLLGALSAVGATAWAEPPTKAGEAAKHDGNVMIFALLRRDYETYVSYRHPALIQKLGSKEKHIAILESRRAGLEGDGQRLVSATVGAPIQMVKAGNELHAILPLVEISRVRGKDGEFHEQAHLLGVSSDDGKTWKFIDIRRMTPNDVRQLLPNYNRKLKLPAHKAPTFVPK